MKKLLMIGIAALATAVATGVNAMSLSDAKNRCDEAIDNPAAVTEIMNDLEASDQKEFVKAIDGAIAKLPGSAEEKAAKYVVVTENALKASAKGNLPTLLAEVFATVPPEALAGLSERYATDLFNRSADPSRKFTDEQFVVISTNALQKIIDRNVGNTDAGVRDTLAAVMFERASNGTPTNLRDTLIAMLPEDVREMAKNDWIPQAMGDNDQQPSYASILAATSADANAPDEKLVNMISGVQPMVMLFADLTCGTGDNSGLGYSSALFGHSLQHDGFGFAGDDLDITRIPRTMNKGKRWNPIYKRGEPEPYINQSAE